MTGSTPDLACQELVELVTDYLEEALTLEERTRFELHLNYCDSCRTYVRQMRQVLASAGRLEEASVSPEARAALLAAFRDWRKGPGGGRP